MKRVFSLSLSFCLTEGVAYMARECWEQPCCARTLWSIGTGGRTWAAAYHARLQGQVPSSRTLCTRSTPSPCRRQTPRVPLALLLFGEAPLVAHEAVVALCWLLGDAVKRPLGRILRQGLRSEALARRLHGLQPRIVMPTAQRIRHPTQNRKTPHRRWSR